MSTSEWIAIASLAMGFFITIIGSVWHLSFKIGAVHEKLSSLDKRVTWLEQAMEDVRKTIVQIRIEMTEMQVKLDVLWRHHLSGSNSPIALNEAGAKILASSDIGAFIAGHYEEILLKVKALKPENAYQTQELLISVVSRYKKSDEHRLQLQATAFASGHDVDSVLFVGRCL